MIRNRPLRRSLGIALVVLGAIFMWAAASPLAGSVLLALAIVLEGLGIRLERQQHGG